MKTALQIFPSPAEMAELRRYRKMAPAKPPSANICIVVLRRIFSAFVCFILACMVIAAFDKGPKTAGQIEIYAFTALAALYATIGWRVDLAGSRAFARWRAGRALKRQLRIAPQVRFEPGVN